jgi:hypothetical protein
MMKRRRVLRSIAGERVESDKKGEQSTRPPLKWIVRRDGEESIYKGVAVLPRL